MSDLSLHNIVDGMATAPLPPPAPSFVVAMGRTNDAIIYGGEFIHQATRSQGS